MRNVEIRMKKELGMLNELSGKALAAGFSDVTLTTLRNRRLAPFRSHLTPHT